MEELLAIAAADGSALGDDISVALAAASVALHAIESDEDEEVTAESNPAAPPQKRSRKYRKRRDKATCAWAQLLKDPDLNNPTSLAAKEFRQDFRIPYVFFLRLVEVVKAKQWFSTRETDGVGRACHPVEHKVRNS